MTVFSRIRTESISKELFNKFSENNTEVAWEYAFSREIRKKNNVEAELESVEYEILHNELQIKDLMDTDTEMIVFQIQCPFDFNVRVSTVIRTCLQLSSCKLGLLLEADAVYHNEKPLQKKYKIKNGDIIKIRRQELIKTYPID